MNEKLQYAHGGDIYRISEVYGIGLEEILDYSSNINPLGLPEEIKEVIINNMDKLTCYPDTFCSDLRKEISGYLDVPFDSIIVGNGAVEVIFLYLDTVRPGKLLIPVPAFSEYERSARMLGLEVEFLELREETGFTLDSDSISDRVLNGIEALFLCNPNNPTSTLLNRSDLLNILDFTAAKNIKVVVDETFIELTPEGNKNSLADSVREYENLFIVRAFTKIFSMPGIRLGYGIGNENIIRKMWDKKMPWSVNSFACMAGHVLNHGNAYLRRTGEWLKEETEWFFLELNKIAGLKVFKPQTNFILIKILRDKLTSARLKDDMAKKGILIRDASNFRGLNEKYIRIAVKDRESNLKFLKVLKEILGWV
ncbi:MAG: pyridoxal phosphate-dependent aminotransferase [Bacillota bacterium]